MENHAVIYTDGSCLGNPGPGGYGIIWDLDDGTHQEFSAGAYRTTNNRMELSAVVTALTALRGASFDVDLYTDSKYVVDAIQKHWLDGWVNRGWKKSDGQSVKNIDLWTSMLVLLKTHQVNFHWVKGHDGNPNNERCDELARNEALRYKNEIEENNRAAMEVSEIETTGTVIEIDDNNIVEVNDND